MQGYKDIPETRNVGESRADILNNILTVMSNSSGTAFPTTNLQVGMNCWRTDQRKMYVLDAITPIVKWELAFDASSNQADAVVSKGTLTSALNFNATQYLRGGVWEIALSNWNGCSAAPTGLGSRGTLISIVAASGRNHIYIDAATGIAMQRSYLGTAWGSWFRYMTIGEDSTMLIYPMTISGTVNAIVGTGANAPVTELADGITVSIRVPGRNTNPNPTFKADATAAKPVRKFNNLPLDEGDMVGYHILRYSTAYGVWILLNPAVTVPPGEKSGQILTWDGGNWAPKDPPAVPTITVSTAELIDGESPLAPGSLWLTVEALS
ncbi:hypothetical protein LJC19_04645 [Oxalobacter sp. OttesenSCG-928-P03]|nr:hypothetical protein [Oxalobacter sp. OttesenSCG-928-P03]